MSTGFESGFRPPLAIKRIVSILIVLHLTAIVAAVTSGSSGRFTAPSLAIRLVGPFGPYLRFIFMANPYRFFAPNPGSAAKLYFRILRLDGTASWVEFPRRQEVATAYLYHRYLKIAEHGVRTTKYLGDIDKDATSTGKESDKTEPRREDTQRESQKHPQNDTANKSSKPKALEATQENKVTLSEDGTICIGSFVRHVVRNEIRLMKDAGLSPVTSVEVYEVGYSRLSRAQARSGWLPTDLRLYYPSLLGKFDLNGKRMDDVPIRNLEMNELVADMLTKDRVFEQAHREGDKMSVGTERGPNEEDGSPEPVRLLVVNFPELLDAPEKDLAERIKKTVADSAPAPKEE